MFQIKWRIISDIFEANVLDPFISKANKMSEWKLILPMKPLSPFIGRKYDVYKWLKFFLQESKPQIPRDLTSALHMKKNVKEVGVCLEIPKMNINNTNGRNSI